MIKSALYVLASPFFLLGMWVLRAFGCQELADDLQYWFDRLL